MQERSRKEKNILYIVVPCYNEEQVLAETSKRLKEKCEMLIISPIIPISFETGVNGLESLLST